MTQWERISFPTITGEFPSQTSMHNLKIAPDEFSILSVCAAYTGFESAQLGPKPCKYDCSTGCNKTGTPKPWQSGIKQQRELTVTGHPISRIELGSGDKQLLSAWKEEKQKNEQMLHQTGEKVG
jgi:hypothetical protein